MNYINAEVIKGVLIPFAGTVLGSASVFLLKNAMNERIQKALTGFAAGVMVAASIWSLIIPAIEASGSMGRLAFAPAFAGIWCLQLQCITYRKEWQ